MNVHVRFWAGVATLFLVMACTAPAWWTDMPERDRQAWQRCNYKVGQAQCGAGYEGDTVYRGICTRDLMKRYANETASSKGRRQWLVAHGCPPPMANAY